MFIGFRRCAWMQHYDPIGSRYITENAIFRSDREEARETEGEISQREPSLFRIKERSSISECRLGLRKGGGNRFMKSSFLEVVLRWRQRVSPGIYEGFLEDTEILLVDEIEVYVGRRIYLLRKPTNFCRVRNVSDFLRAKDQLFSVNKK